MSQPKTVSDAVIAESEFWLPDDCMLNLTALELGGLMACLMVAKAHGCGTATINKRGPNGERVPVMLVDRLLEKVEAARNKAEAEAKARR
jgi:hypothetical protein